MGLVDIILLAIALVALAIGVYKGFAGLLLGFVGTLILAIVIAVAAPFAVNSFMYKDKEVGANAADETLGYSVVFYKLYEMVSPAFVDKDSDFFDAVYAQSDDGLGVVTEDEDGNSVVVPLNEFLFSGLNDTPYGSYLSGITGVTNKLTTYGAEGLTIGHSLAALVTFSIVCALFWFVLFFVAVILKLVLKHFIYKALDSHGVASKIDRAVGAIMMVVIVIGIIWSAFSFIDAYKTTWHIEDGVNSLISRNTSLSLMSQNNLFNILGLSGSTAPDTEYALHAIDHGLKPLI